MVKLLSAMIINTETDTCYHLLLPNNHVSSKWRACRADSGSQIKMLKKPFLTFTSTAMIRTILALMLGCLSLSTLGQSGYTVTITGPTSVSLGTTYVYNVSWKYNGTPTSAPPNGTFDWTVFGGTASSKGINSAPVQWSTLPGYILYEYWAGGSYYYATLNVSSNSCAPKPVVSFSLSSDVCAPRQLSYTGTPPSGVTWYWQTSSSGTSMSNSTNSYSVVTPGTYYVRAYNNASSCWGSESASYTVSTVTAGPPVPTTPTADTNTCGSKALFHDDPPTGVTWYWQQTADGTSMSNPGVHLAQQTGAYYLRARDNSSGCWSAGSASIYVTVDNGPSNTPAFAVSTNECGVKTLTKPVADPGVQLFWQGTNSSGTDTSEPAQAQTYTANVTGTYYLRAASSNGCWGEPYSSLIEVDGPLPEVPTGLTASDITTSSFTAQWTPTANAYDYVVEVALYGSFSNPLKTITMSNNSAAIADLSAGENYHFRVRARNECGKSVISAPVPVQLPTEPPVALPATVVTSSSFLINWQQVNGATAYYFDLATDISFTPSSLIFDNANTSSASGFTGNPNGPILVYNMPLETQAYYYRIRAANSAGSSANSNVITVLPLSAAPVAKPATNVTKTSFVANWNTVPWTNEFRVDVSTDKEFTSMVSGYEDVPVTGNSLLVENLGRGRVYYYRVRSAVPTAVSANSNTIMVVTNNDYNYIKYTDVTIGQLYTAEQVAGVSIGDKLVKYDYFDGKGRLLQTVMQQASPLGADVVQPIEYDTFGRQAKQFLPYVAPSANGQFRHQFVEEQWQFYANGPANVAKDAYPYTLTVFEHSPLNRVVKQGAPGGTWQPDGNESYESTDRTVKFAYQVNAVADQVILWTYVPSTSYPLGLVTSGTGTGPSYYLTGELYKTKSKDEHNNEVVEFKDKEDRIILKRVQAPGNAWAETYYIYDDRGNLVTVLPPMATAGLNEEYFGQNEAAKDAYLHRWAFRYAYDGRNRMSQKQVPGAAPVYMVYDEFNRLVLTQDGNQRQSNQWAFTKYDALNRPVLTGIYTHQSNINQESMQEVVNTHYGNESVPRFEARGDVVHGYTNQTFPSVGSEADYLTVTYYDDYAFGVPQEFEYDGSELEDQELEELSGVKGQVTGTKVKNLEDGSWYLSVNYYDDRYRVIQTVAENHGGALIEPRMSTTLRAKYW